MNRASSRLFVLTARDVPRAVILRRGPSRWYHIIRWQTDNDTFEHGAWIHARIYEEKCDLSPDGELLLYFCFGGSLRAGYTDAWTAVSRAPWLHALALWPWGTTWGGGGRFLDKRTLALRAGVPVATHPDHPATGLEVVYGNTDIHRSRNDVQPSDWCGRDHSERLIYTRGGKLFRRDSSKVDQEVADFTGLVPEPAPPPAWATNSLGAVPGR